MLFSILLSLLITPTISAPNEPCYGPNGIAGVCITDAACTTSGGTSVSGACPRDAANIKCCSKPQCTSGNCRWQSDCAGSSVGGQCPGPSQMKCCSAGGTGFGGYPAAKIPAVGGCKQVSVDGARTVVNALPGRVREVFCTRDCSCPGSSDHCCGLAIDFMCADGGGSATLSGKDIAEWVMKNHSALKVKYIIWGQRIWTASVDQTQKSWDTWRTMEDRNDLTQNHWDHVHVSFNG